MGRKESSFSMSHTKDTYANPCKSEMSTTSRMMNPTKASNSNSRLTLRQKLNRVTRKSSLLYATKTTNSMITTQKLQSHPCRSMFSLKNLILLALVMLSGVGVQSIAGTKDWMQTCSSCHCHWNSGKKTADCKSRKFTKIPKDLSSEMQVIDLSYNMMAEIRREEFIEANLENVHKLFLKNCTIQEIHREAFKGLGILIEIDLSNNFIRELHAETFQAMVKLRTVVLNNNEIEVLPDYLFSNFQFLARVELKNNHLKQIDLNTFSSSPFLTSIFMESNSLTVLKKDIFSQIPKLIHLSLAANPWNCTCELQEFQDYVKTNRLYTPPTACQEPANLRGKLWTEIDSDGFACKPRILGSNRTYFEVQSENITLPCRIEAKPRANVTWIFNKRIINQNDPRYKVTSSVEKYRYEQSNLMTSELNIYGVRSSDKGVYTCLAENRAGATEAELHLLFHGDTSRPLDGKTVMGGAFGNSDEDSKTGLLLVICLITAALLLIFILILLILYWYCRRVKSYQKDSTMLSDNALITSKMEKTHTGSILEGSVIIEMQKSLLTEVNPVEKPPRRSEFENNENNHDDGHEIKKTLLDENPYGAHPRGDDETHSVALSDTTTPRTRHTYIDDTYASSLPPDLLAFPARHPPTSPSMQSSHTNIPEQVIYGIRSPTLTSPVYTHMTPHGIYGTTTIAAATPNGFMTLQHPKSRNLALIAAANARQQHHHQLNAQQNQQQQQQQQMQNHHPHQQLQQFQQSPFVQAPVVYSPTAAVVMKQGYMTIPRKPRVPSWAPSTSGASLSAVPVSTSSANQQQSQQMNEFQSPTSPNPSETGTATTAELISEPVYDNLGLRTTAAGNSTLNLNRPQNLDAAVRYNMRDRPLPATPSLTSVASSTAQLLPNHQQQPQPQQQSQQQQQQQQQHQQNNQQPQPQQQMSPSNSSIMSGGGNGTSNKIYEPIQEFLNQQHQQMNQISLASFGSDTEPLYGSGRHHSTLTLVPTSTNGTGAETRISKIPPRPPPKPKKKMSVTTSKSGQGSTSQLFDDEGEDGTEV